MGYFLFDFLTYIYVRVNTYLEYTLLYQTFHVKGGEKMDEATKKINLDFTKANCEIELASIHDADLMRIICFGTHEGENLNGVVFPKKVLAASCRSFVDKPVVIVPNKYNLPTGHGFDFNKQTFDLDKRKNVGHITDAYPVFVTEDDGILEVYDMAMLDDERYANCELRIITELVVYKNYFADIAERLEFLHSIGNLSFSMEALVSSYKTEDDSKVCTDIMFTGLAIVDEPAFVNSKSIEVSEKEEKDMEFKEMYEAEKAKNEALVAEKATVESELATSKEELTSTKEELANVKTELAEVKAEVESLKPFKEQVELAEKENLGKERLAKLEKLGVKDLDAMELAEKTKEEFADMLVEAADKYVPEVAEKQDDVMGLPEVNTGMKSNKEKLIELLGKF